MRPLLAIVLALAVTGCGARKTATEAASGDSTVTRTAAATGATPREGITLVPGGQEPVANVPAEITEITNQQLVYECRQCGSMYDENGQCPKDGSQLYPAKLSYVCPADNLPADHAGRCPRCGQIVRIMKTAIGPDGMKVTRVN
jgi:hypothetical protein